MHYILLALALNLGREEVSIMTYNDMKEAVRVAKKEKKNGGKNATEVQPSNQEIEPIIPLQNIIDDNLVVDNTFLNDNIAVEPYIPSNEFAELLPEDEKGNIIQEEEQGPKFLDNIKNKLIEVSGKNKNDDVVLGNQEEGPSFFDNIRDRILNKDKQSEEKIVASEDIGPQLPTKKDSEALTQSTDKKTDEKKTDKPVVKDSNKKEDKKPIVVDAKTKETAEKPKDTLTKAKDIIKNIDIKNITKPGFIDSLKGKIEEGGGTEEEKLEELKIVGTLLESEINQALKSGKLILDRESTTSNVDENVEYKEDEDYQKFLDEKEIEKLVRPEKILAPNIKPRAKELYTYKTLEVPQELLEQRSYQNRHIPKIIQRKDKEVVLGKIIEYGMLPELKAFMNDFRDANLLLNNQYTLLTYATKYRQYDIMKYLIHIGADVNKRDDRLDTPLIIATRNNDLTAIKILMNANANPDMVDILKRTPLIYSIEKGYTPIAIYLIDNNANVNIANGVGEGTLAMSIRLGRNVIKEKILDVLRKQQNEK